MAPAGRNHQVRKQPTLRIFSPRGADREGLSTLSTAADEEEFDEADVVWANRNLMMITQPAEPREPVRTSRPRARTAKVSDQASSTPASSSAMSAPVKVPDWSKILLHEYKSSHSNMSSAGYDDDWIDVDDDHDEAAEAARLPPHEMMMMRRRATSLSVVEGVGRTLKGRDMRRVRNSIWARTGFQD